MFTLSLKTRNDTIVPICPIPKEAVFSLPVSFIFLFLISDQILLLVASESVLETTQSLETSKLTVYWNTGVWACVGRWEESSPLHRGNYAWSKPHLCATKNMLAEAWVLYHASRDPFIFQKSLIDHYKIRILLAR